jgi:hypothetical protein
MAQALATFDEFTRTLSEMTPELDDMSAKTEQAR